MDFPGVHELEIVQQGNGIVLRPVRPDWVSFANVEKADSDFLLVREDVISDEGRFDL
jgi:antitoxin VapB